jgi:DNA-binding CsgD family transcriptional regulator
MNLTPREMQVCELLDLTRREIGQELGISPRTVQAHIKSIMDKLGVHSRVEVAVQYQFSAGFGVDGHANADELEMRGPLPVAQSGRAPGWKPGRGGSNPPRYGACVESGKPATLKRAA